MVLSHVFNKLLIKTLYQHTVSFIVSNFPHTNLFISYNKIDAFLKKNGLWKNRVKKYTFYIFPNFFNMTQKNISTKNEINEMCIIIEEHLGRLREKMSKYFDPTKYFRKSCNKPIYTI